MILYIYVNAGRNLRDKRWDSTSETVAGGWTTRVRVLVSRGIPSDVDTASIRLQIYNHIIQGDYRSRRVRHVRCTRTYNSNLTKLEITRYIFEFSVC